MNNSVSNVARGDSRNAKNRYSFSHNFTEKLNLVKNSERTFGVTPRAKMMNIATQNYGK
jgi:hypothetical protein